MKLLIRSGGVAFFSVLILLFFRTEVTLAQSAIPERMKPLTIIKYISGDKYKTVRQGKQLDNIETEFDCNWVELPRPATGMVIHYNSNGCPSLITGMAKPESSTSYNRAGLITEGKFSNFPGGTDERGFKVQKYDCATQWDLDDPPYGTPIRATNKETGKTIMLRKTTVGSLAPNVVLDVTPSAFKEFGTPLRKGHFKGEYYHD